METSLLNKSKQLWFFGLGILLFCLIISSTILIFPFDKLKSWIDLLASDGNLESFTPELIAILTIPGIVGLVVSLCGTFYFIAFRQRSLNWINSSIIWYNRFIYQREVEIKEIWVAVVNFESDRKVIFLLLLITFIAAINRIAFLWRPMGHDEAYTFIAFASRGLRIAVTDYHLPNNHVFHTILVSIAYQLFGDSPAVVRLPSVMAGILTVPAIFLVAKNFYDRETGLVSAAIIASAPVMIDYSTNARGYSIIALLTLLLLACAAYVVKHKNLIAWAFIVILACLGMYTNPTMVYPIAVVYCWIFFNAVFQSVDPEYDFRIYLYLLISAISIGALSAILYAPIVIYSGFDSLIGNNFIASLSWSDFVESIPVRIRNTWQEWNRGLPLIVSALGITGFVASIALSFTARKRTVPLALTGFIAIGVALVLQRVAPWPRVWLFLFPLFVMWTIAGLLGIIRLVIERINAKDSLIELCSSIFVVFLLVLSISRSYSYYETKSNSMGEVEEAAVFLSSYLEPGDVVVVKSPDTVILDFYLRRHGIDREYLELSDQLNFRRSLVLVNNAYGQDLEKVLENRSVLERVNPTQAELVYQANRISIYLIPYSQPERSIQE
jgi:uncharacterized membrane protein